MATVDFNQIQNAADLGGLPSDPGKFISNAIPIAFSIAGMILVVNIVLSGWSMILGKGDPKAMEGAQKRITWSIVGVLVIIFAYVLVQIVENILGMSIGDLI